MQIKIEIGDITTYEVDAIVNAANRTLLGGGGVDGAIHRAAGPELLKECKALNGCDTGEAKITQGYRLPSPYVIHTVGPIWKGGYQSEAVLLANCYRNSILLAEQKELRSMAFPAISTGAFQFPLDKAAGIAIDTVSEMLKQVKKVEKIIFVCFDDKTYQAYHQINA